MRMILVMFSLMMASVLTVPAFAQNAQPAAPAAQAVAPAAAVPAPAVAVAPAAQPGQGVMNTLQNVDNKIPISVAAWVLAVIGFLTELLMRFMPSVQPRSLFLMVSGIFKLISDIFAKMSGLLDLVVQNIKDPSAGGPSAKA